MSALYVRNKSRQWAQETSALMGFQFYDTVNRDQDPQDAVWWSMVFTSLQADGTFCTRPYMESGLVDVIVSAAPGTGDEAAIMAMESIIPDLMDKVDPTRRLIYERWDPLAERSAGSANRFYSVSVSIDYRFNL